MTPPRYPHRRLEDDYTSVRLTGRTGRQLAVQVLGGLLLAVIVAAGSVWGTVQILGEQVGALTRAVQDLRDDVREIRRDLYQPRYDRGAFMTTPDTSGAPWPAR